MCPPEAKSIVQNKKGIILVLVLWVMFFLSVAALTLGYMNRINIRLRSLRNESLRMRYLAQEGINRAIIKLSADETESDSFFDNWSKDFSLQKDEGLLSYKVIDEDRFININKAESELLEGLEVIVPELSEQEFKAIELMRPFNVKREIISALEIEEEIFYGNADLGKIGLNDVITVFSDARININTVSKETLMLLPGMTETAAISIIDRRSGSAFESNDTISEDLSIIGLTAAQISSIIKLFKVDSAWFRIKAEAVSSRKKITRSIEVVVHRNEGTFNTLIYKEN